ncbi:MAG TPA: hypothetical protein VFX70_20565 [Mycobacteriales bacterium]|nr:hypothetical protein [Mycobacteriales bacterium]
MVTLTRLLGAYVRWVTGSPRRMIATLAVPVVGAILLFGPDRDTAGHALTAASPPPPDATTGGTGGGHTPVTGGTAGGGSGPGGSALPTPSTVTVGPSDRPRPVPALPAAPAAVATGYVRTVDSHDARPGHDHDFADSYRRARRFVTAQVYALITAPSQRGDYQWTTWVAQHATVTVRVDRAAVPDGAPLPTASTVYVRVRFTQTVTPATRGTRPSSIPGEITVVTRRQPDGRWLVARLLAA